MPFVVLGFSAALQLAIPEDYGLVVAGVVATILILSRNRRLRDTAALLVPAAL